MEFLRSFTSVFGFFNSKKSENNEIDKNLIDIKPSKNENFEENINNTINNIMFYKNNKSINKKQIKYNETLPLLEKSKQKITYIRKNDPDESYNNN